MFDLELQRRIREKKTPLALTLAPETEKLNGKFVKNFIDMFGDTPMAQAEALRYHGTTLLDAAAGKLPAVVLRGGAYLRHGMMGADVLANLVSAAHAKELYVILNMNTAEPECWAGYGAEFLINHIRIRRNFFIHLIYQLDQFIMGNPFCPI